jgi:hypothetical protein
MKSPSPIVPLPGACLCGAASVAIDPGQAAEYSETGILVSRGRPVAGWCLAFWPLSIARSAL